MSLMKLVAGPLAMSFDPATAFLRWISLNDVEIVRGVFAAVRDADWNTVPFSLSDLDVEQQDGSFVVRFLAASLRADIPFDWQGHITGNDRGHICYAFKGQSHGAFFRNRIGLCVLHPILSCADVRCHVEHTDGTITEGVFPKWIAPHQPFQQIRSITHSVEPQLNCRVTLQGDTFEMEDHRNWSDASFKTYSTPLELPFPVSVARGDVVEQSVTIELLGKVPVTAAPTRAPESRCVALEWRDPQRRPAIGFLLPDQPEQVPQAVIDRLRQIRPDHLRVDVRLNVDSGQGPLERAIELARQVGAALEVALFADDDAWQRRAPAFLDRLKRVSSVATPVARWLVFHPTEKATPPSLAERAGDALRRFETSTPIVVGTDAYFAELNRHRPQPIDNHPVCYSINPQVHAFDNDSLSETLEAQPWTVDSAVAYFGTSVSVSPITLRPRFNPNATSQPVDPARSLESAIDPRQTSGFGAAWTAGVLAGLATHPRVHSLTLYEAFGPRGVMDYQGNNYPLTPLLEHVLNCHRLVAGSSTHPRDVAAFGTLDRAGRRHLVLANLTDGDLTIELCLRPDHAQRVTVSAELVHMLTLAELPDA